MPEASTQLRARGTWIHDHSPLSGAGAENVWSYTSTPRVYGVHSDNLLLPLIIEGSSHERIRAKRETERERERLRTLSSAVKATTNYVQNFQGLGFLERPGHRLLWRCEMDRAGSGEVMTLVLTLQSPVVISVPRALTVQNVTFFIQSAFVCFVWISEQTAAVSPYSIN